MEFEQDGLNPRFDGAFLNLRPQNQSVLHRSLNPRFDGAFLNCILRTEDTTALCLNPRFDGAFLNLSSWVISIS